MLSTPDVSPTTSTGEVEVRRAELPLTLLPPQHLAPPAVVTAHTVWVPVAMDFTPAVRPSTSTAAVLRSIPVPSPFRLPAPRHFTPPVGVNAQTMLFVLMSDPDLT